MFTGEIVEIVSAVFGSAGLAGGWLIKRRAEADFKEGEKLVQKQKLEDTEAFHRTLHEQQVKDTQERIELKSAAFSEGMTVGRKDAEHEAECRYNVIIDDLISHHQEDLLRAQKSGYERGFADGSHQGDEVHRRYLEQIEFRHKQDILQTERAAKAEGINIGSSKFFSELHTRYWPKIEGNVKWPIKKDSKLSVTACLHWGEIEISQKQVILITMTRTVASPGELTEYLKEVLKIAAPAAALIHGIPA